jgi:UPF0176 protein
MSQKNFRVVAFYRFVAGDDLPAHQRALKAIADSSDICGTILIAPEGVNGTIASSDDGIDRAIAYLDTHFGIHAGEVKYSTSSVTPFQRFKVRLKKEIITMREPDVNPTQRVGTYVAPQDWNDVITDPDVLVLDTRNVYETKIGTFQNALDPQINVFTDFVTFVREKLDPKKHQKVAMFCTGGIRCEKASSFMLNEGFETVYHLKGGILKYLEDVPAEKSLWQGECFVFDKRVGVHEGLEEAAHRMCYGCRTPLDETELASPLYEEGVTCPHCHAVTSEKIANRRRMRHTQMMKARA